jgi:hypothetical protein
MTPQVALPRPSRGHSGAAHLNLVWSDGGENRAPASRWCEPEGRYRPTESSSTPLGSLKPFWLCTVRRALSRLRYPGWPDRPSECPSQRLSPYQLFVSLCQPSNGRKVRSPRNTPLILILVRAVFPFQNAAFRRILFDALRPCFDCHPPGCQIYVVSELRYFIK